MSDVLQTAPIFLGQAVTSLSRSELRWEFANIAAAVTILAIASVRNHPRKLFRWLLAAQVVFAVFGILAAALLASLSRMARQ